MPGKKTSASVVFIVLFLLVAPVWAVDTVRITNGEWPPYLSEHLPFNGVASRIVTEAFALEGVKVEYGFFPWKRSLALAETGEWDGSAVWFRSPEREELFYISDPVILSSYVFFHLKNYLFDWRTVDDLREIRIGATLGYNYGEPFEAAEKKGKITVDRCASDELNFEKLLNDRFKIFPVDMEVGYTMLHKQFKPETVILFTNHPRPLRQESLHLLLSKKVGKNKRLIELFNRGLQKLKESGRIERFLEESRKGERTSLLNNRQRTFRPTVPMALKSNRC